MISLQRQTLANGAGWHTRAPSRAQRQRLNPRLPLLPLLLPALGPARGRAPPGGAAREHAALAGRRGACPRCTLPRRAAGAAGAGGPRARCRDVRQARSRRGLLQWEEPRRRCACAPRVYIHSWPRLAPVCLPLRHSATTSCVVPHPAAAESRAGRESFSQRSRARAGGGGGARSSQHPGHPPRWTADFFRLGSISASVWSARRGFMPAEFRGAAASFFLSQRRVLLGCPASRSSG